MTKRPTRPLGCRAVSQPSTTVCAIAGGSGAGKTTLAAKLLDRLGDRGVHHTIDWYYRDLSALTPAERDLVNFDHPDSLEVELFVADLECLRSGVDIEAPVYDFATHTRRSDTHLAISARPRIVAEGIHLLALAPVRETCDLLVYVDVDAEIRLERRVRRDVAERGRTPESVRAQWAATVAPMHDEFVQPSMVHADRIVTVDEDFDEVASELVQRLDALG